MANVDTLIVRIEADMRGLRRDLASVQRQSIATTKRMGQGFKATQASIGDTLEGVRTEMNQLQKDITASIHEVEGTIRQTDRDLQADLRALDEKLSQKLQEALDNPLSR